MIVLASVFEALSGYFGGLRQALLAAGGVQWLGVFVLANICLAQRRGYGYLLTVTGLEVLKGFTGYFSDFRLVFFVLLVATFWRGSKFGSGRVLIAMVVATALLMAGAWWSAIKLEYRDYLDQGSRQQAVLVPFEDRLSFLMSKLSQVDSQTIRVGFERLALRVGYVDFLAATMRHVPSALPFQDGAQIGATVMHVLEPRLLFPDKPPLPSDTEILQKYTGIRFGQSSGAGTSVSLGYVAELYVDFGVPGAVLGTFIMGLLGGRAFRFVVSSHSLPAVINYGLAVMLAMTVTQFDEALIKIVGSFLTTLGVILVLRRFLLPHLLNVLALPYQRRVLAQPAE